MAWSGFWDHRWRASLPENERPLSSVNTVARRPAREPSHPLLLLLSGPRLPRPRRSIAFFRLCCSLHAKLSSILFPLTAAPSPLPRPRPAKRQPPPPPSFEPLEAMIHGHLESSSPDSFSICFHLVSSFVRLVLVSVRAFSSLVFESRRPECGSFVHILSRYSQRYNLWREFSAATGG